MTHYIDWAFEDGRIWPKAGCDDPQCLNRYTCADAPCEVYYDVRREDDGTVTHKPWDDEHPAINRHRMEKTDDCSLLDFLNADPYILTELNDGHQRFLIGRTEIEAVWQGEDGALWRVPVDESSGSGSDA